MKFLATFLLLATVSTAAHAQRTGPEVTSWILNLTGKTGYHGISSNVQQVRYSADNVYVSCTCIPGYDIGPWAGNPNTPMNQNFVFKITRHPAQNTGTATATPLGHIGIWTNGVSIFNAKDAHSYNNQNVWNQNAIIVEGSSFDACLGHPAPNGEYHHHLNPRCLYDDQDSSHHSPIIGFAFDGYPIYGAYGYRNTDGSGGVTRMRSSYRLRSLTQRNSLPGGGTLQQSQYGPDVSPQYPLGFYIEDFEFVQGFGDLDLHNGRFCVTPEYPNGTYAYFVTLDVDGNAAYPYILGPTYYGVVSPGNTGPQSGHNTPAEQVTTYTGTSDVEAPVEAQDWNIYPNPATDIMTVQAPTTDGDWRISISDLLGHDVASMGTIAGGSARTVSVAGLVSGVYLMHFESATQTRTTRLVIAR